MKAGDNLYRVWIDIDEEDSVPVKSSCSVDKFIVSSIQKRKHDLEKYVYIAWEDSGDNHHRMSLSRWKEQKEYSYTEIGALRLAIKSIPKIIKDFKDYADNVDDQEYYLTYKKYYNTVVKKVLNRMIQNRERKIAKKKAKK